MYIHRYIGPVPEHWVGYGVSLEGLSEIDLNGPLAKNLIFQPFVCVRNQAKEKRVIKNRKRFENLIVRNPKGIDIYDFDFIAIKSNLKS